jgi:hypothetical protein
MTSGRFNTPLIAAGGTLLGGGAACYQITGDMFSLSPIILDHLGYLLAVAAAFGAVEPAAIIRQLLMVNANSGAAVAKRLAYAFWFPVGHTTSKGKAPRELPEAL